MYLYLYLFFVYAFLGWCTEVIYSALHTGKFVNRGFLNGPICPIYGVGILSVYKLLNSVMSNKIYLFIGSVILTSTVELITGFILEKLFHKKWWDYSNMPLNIGGYICLKFSLKWGLACIMVFEIVHPVVLNFISFIPRNIGSIILYLLLNIFFIDIIATVQSVIKVNKKLKLAYEISKEIRKVSDEIGAKISKGSLLLIEKNEEIISELDRKVESKKQQLESLKEKYEMILDKKIAGERRLFRAFPKMNTKRYKETFEELKRRVLNK